MDVIQFLFRIMYRKGNVQSKGLVGVLSRVLVQPLRQRSENTACEDKELDDVSPAHWHGSLHQSWCHLMSAIKSEVALQRDG